MTQLRTNGLITLLTASHVHVSQGQTPQNILQLWIMNTCCFVMTVYYGFSVLICFACLHLKQETIILMKSTTFWDKKPCSLLKVNWCFGGTYHLHLQGWISLARCQVKAGGKPLLKHQLTLNGLHDVVSQKTAFFITTTVRTSNPTIVLIFYQEIKCNQWRGSHILWYCDRLKNT
jgi:hypothetical protein